MHSGETLTFISLKSVLKLFLTKPQWRRHTKPKLRSITTVLSLKTETCCTIMKIRTLRTLVDTVLNRHIFEAIFSFELLLTVCHMSLYP